MKEFYLDNAATTKPSEGAVSLILKVLEEAYGNPSSLHRKGQEAEKYIIEARRKLAKILMADPESIYFTSCATESSNSAIRGAAERGKRRGRHILTSQSEHAATRENLKYLAEQGFEIEELACDMTGRVLLDDLKKKLRQDTILVTCIHVNNETGCINPVHEMGTLIHEVNPDCLFHVDAVQSFAKYPIYPKRYGIDLMSTSAHKINGPKGIGFLYIRRGLHFPSFILGGGQESHFRSGTENVPYIAGFGQAAEEMWAMHEELARKMYGLKRKLVDQLQEAITGIYVNGPEPEEGAAHILNLRVEGVRSEVLLHALEDYGVYVSSGSACASNKPEEKSPALNALGLRSAEIDQSLRISFGRYSTEEDVAACVDAMKTVVPMLRRFVRK
ncbi:MAG: cysteine desulfurase [Firmicutes bacterium]|nr:cysteine desulfurase [Bacillota bacterium]